jgi:hypothetical protein
MNKLPQVVQEAVKAGKPVLQLTGEDDRQYFFLKPNKADMSRFIASTAKGKLVQAVNNLIMEKALYPAADELEKEFVDFPGRMVALNNELQAAIGMNEDFSTKKL